MAQLTVEEQIARLYLATFDRASDADGLEYWVGKVTEGWSVEKVAKSFFDQSETLLKYPATLSISSFIDTVYNNVLDRSPDIEGKAYWTIELESGRVSRDAFIIAVINGAQSGGTTEDKTILENKLDVAINFAVTNELNDLNLATYIMQNVTSDIESVKEAKITLATYKTAFGTNFLLHHGDAYSNLINTAEKNDWIYSYEADDTVYTGIGVNWVDGGDGNDHLYGNSTVDVLLGRAGDDTLYGEGGNDTLFGGYGDDTLHGGDGDDAVYGGEGSDYLYSEVGNNQMFGGADDDTLFAVGGNDTLYGGSGNDVIYTGDGINWVDGEAGDDTIYGGTAKDTLYGGLGNDLLYGDVGDDTLDGMGGNDTLYGGTGNDTLSGNSGSDTLYGGDGNDTISAQEDDDMIYGGKGSESLWGGSGKDTFFFATLESTRDSMDTIMDFMIGITGDRISLIDTGSEVFNSTANPNSPLAATLSIAIDLVSAGDGSVNGILNWFTYQESTYIVYDRSVNTAHDTLSDTVIKLQGLIDLTLLDSMVSFA